MPEVLKEVMKEYKNAGFEIYLVGGGIRNILVGKVPVNCDLTTNATPEKSMDILKIRDPFYNNDFGTVSINVKVDEKEELYEITTYRSEKEYTDFRRPDKVDWGKTLEEDIIRRDFTVNAIVIGEREGKFELIDMVDGLKDFEDGVIRAVGDAETRFGEDALRLMRAIRFAARLGFRIEEKTLAAVSKQAPLLANISRERIRDELLRILETDYPADGIQLLISTGLMKEIMPELLEGRGVEQGGHHYLSVLDHSIEALRNCSSPDVLVRLSALIHDIGKPKSRRFKCRSCGKLYKEITGEVYKCEACGFEQPVRKMITFYGHEVIGARMAEEIVKRLRFNNKQVDKIVTLVRRHMFAYQPEMTDAAIRRLIRKIGKENISDMIMLRIADRKGSGSRTTSWRFIELQKRIGEQLFEPMEVRDMVVNGKDVMELLGVAPGPIIGKVLNSLFEEVIDDTSKNNREYLLAKIKELGSSI